MKVSPQTRRLFTHVRRSVLELDESEAFVTMRVLEAGDSTDLGDLFSQLSESSVRRHFIQRGSRQIDRRSRAFWSLLFQFEPEETASPAEDLWSL